MRILLFLGLLLGAFFSLLLRKATQDDAALAAISFGAYLAIFVIARMNRRQMKSIAIYSIGLAVLSLTGAGFIFAFETSKDGLELADHAAAFHFFGEMLCLVQWSCVALCAFVDWLTPSDHNTEGNGP